MKGKIGEMTSLKFLLLMTLVVLAGSLVALALVKIVPDAKQAGAMRFKIGGGKTPSRTPAVV